MDANTFSWSATLSLVSNQLYRSFGYASHTERSDALYAAILRFLTLQSTSGIMPATPDTQRWLHVVATRMLLDARRLSTRVRTFSELSAGVAEEGAGFEPVSELPAGVEDIGMDISAALARLSPSLRCSFELHTQGFRAEEIAAMLCISREAVHKRVQRARRELQVYLRDYL